jgi:hypothetical protein
MAAGTRRPVGHRAAAYRHMIDDLLAAQSGPWSHPCDVHFARQVTHMLANADRAMHDDC